MTNIYIDESGSMTTKYANHYPYFVIAMILVKDKQRLKTSYKRFVSKNHARLKNTDLKNKMFKDDKFVELKGSCMTEELKIDFLDFFCRNDLFEVYYIRIKNSEIRYGLYNNTARAFNFVLKNALQHLLETGFLPNDDYYLHVDERNERNESRHDLEGYLNTELNTGHGFSGEFNVKYYDSSSNALVQIADVFSNLYYVYCLNGSLKDKMNEKREQGYIKKRIHFPIIF